MAAKKPKNDIESRVQNALAADIPHIYANSLGITVSTSDVLIFLEQNGAPKVTINMSYTLAKTLAVKLGNSIGTLETSTGRPMLVTDEVEAFMREPTK
jgi:hypothetical protein